MRRLTDLIRDYFGFSATEMRGFWVLLTLAIISLLVTPTLREILYQPYAYSQEVAGQQKLDSLIALLENKTAEEPIRPGKEGKNVSTKRNYSFFDPNTATLDVLQQNGMPEWLAKRVVKYREKGGVYRTKSDITKIYGFSASRYAQLEKYIQLPEYKAKTPVQLADFPASGKGESIKSAKKEILKIDINLADSLSLCRIPGIGPVFSSRIIRFRDKLGGLYDPKQFSEVYQLSPEAIDNLGKYAYISESFQVQKVNINTDDVSTLAKHPYISFPLAKAMVRHREDYGKYERLVDSKEVYLMDEATFQKIAPYLSL
ncbi:MAG: helix-hairpin-helix domain-containing protein [Cyclobacteriaceae bacterium]